MWREELAGKIVVVSDVTTGSGDVGPVPTDPRFPLSGVHAHALHTILTGDFLRTLSGWEMWLVELAVLGLLLFLALRLPPLKFALGSVALGVGYVAVVALFFFYGQALFNLVRPLMMVGFSAVSVLAYRYVDELEMQVQERTWELEETHTKLADAQAQLISKLEKELQTAGELQMELMPESPPEVPGLDIAGRCIPASQVGGDFYQFFLSEDRLAVVLADVTGHAMEAAIPMVMFNGILESQMELGGTVDALFERLNRSLNRTLSRRKFVCCTMGDLNLKDGTLRLCNGGCPYPYHFRAATGELVELELDAYPLGVEAGSTYEAAEVRLEPGDRVIFCSDGIVEADDGNENQLGFKRTAEVIREACADGLSAEGTIDRILEVVAEFRGDADQSDDMTCVVVRVL